MDLNSTNLNVLSKFKGCMIGGLLGDCLGCPFQFDCGELLAKYFGIQFDQDGSGSKTVLEKFFTMVLNEEGFEHEHLPYTDDTAMSLSIARSLIEKGKVDPTDMAKRFTDEYFRQPERDYGPHVVNVFKALRDSDFKDVFAPAKLQFRGTGSFGNGAAMRIAPLALFCVNKDETYIKKAVEDTSYITHTHPYGWIGGLLQCLAVHEALLMDPKNTFDPVAYITRLQKRLLDAGIKAEDTPYHDALQKIIELHDGTQAEKTPEEIGKILGKNVSAQKSVPTAIYSFLRGFRSLPDYESNNPFLRTLRFAISLGGDTDTIACMAGSISGAYFGVDVIPEVLRGRAENIAEVTILAEQLYNVVNFDKQF